MTDAARMAVATVNDLMDALGKLRELRNVSLAELDALAGMPDRYSQKILGGVPNKKLGAVSLFPLVGALGARLVLEHDAEAWARVSKRVAHRSDPCLLSAAKQASIVLRFSRRHMAKLGVAGGKASKGKLSPKQRTARARKAGLARSAKLSPEQRKRIAVKGAKRRWSKPRIIEITATQIENASPPQSCQAPAPKPATRD
jgi:hypothetical protein